MRYVVYAQWQKARHFTAAIVAGFPGEVYNIDPVRMGSGCTHVLGGLQFGCLQLMQQIRERKEPYIFFDRAYFGGGSQTQQIRLTKNGYQKSSVDIVLPGGRLSRWGAWPKERVEGDFITVVPPTKEVEQLFGLRFWTEMTLKRLERITDRKVILSPKNDRKSGPIEDRLKGCHAVVTWTSNVAVDAIMQGIPAFCSEYAAAHPVANSLDLLETRIEQPHFPTDPLRLAWANSLAWGQFTVEEIASGLARRVLEGGLP